MRLPVSLGWKAGLLLALAIQSFAPQASVSVNAQAVQDVGVTAIELPTGPVNQGDTAEIKVTIENLGSSTASVMVILNYLDADYTAAGVGQTMQDVAAGQTSKASFSWDTTGVPLGSYIFQAVALLDGTGDDNHNNNSLLSTDAVTIVAQTVADVGVTAIQVPTDPVNQGDIVEIDVTVQNLGSATASVMVILLDTTDPGQVAEKTEDIDAEATKVVTLSWDTTDASLGNHTLRAVAVLEGDTNVDNDSLLSTDAVNITAPVTYGVAVTSVAVPTGPVTQGDVVSVDVVIENSSSVAAMFTVTLFNQPAGGTEGTAAEETVEIDAAATKTVTLSWDTSDAAPGAHTFRAGVALVEDPKVSDSQDSASTITIGALTYGVSITAFDVPSGPATQGDVIPAKVTVKNLGSVAAMFTVTLFNQPASGTEGTAAEETVEIAAAATKTVTLSWDTSDAAPGVHTFRAGVTLLDDPKVSDSQDSAATITVSPPPYAVAVTAVEVASATVIQGATVDVEVTVENQGASDANAKVRLLYVPAEGEPVTVAEKTVAIAAGESETITLSWDTSDAPLGVYTVRADATLVEDGTAADSRDAASTITIVTPPPYAVAVTAVEVTIAEAIQGETVEVDVTVANLGTSDANAKVTLLYVPDVPAQGQPGIAAEETVAVAAGESETITLSWDTSDATPGVYTIRAGVTLAEDSNAADSRDAASTITISPLTYGVSITAFDVPSGPATQGDVVDAYVTVENLGSVAAMFTVTLFNQPADGPENAADHETVEIAAAATKTVTLSWDTSDAAPGAHTFRAGVALVGDPKVSDSQDSAATITISIPPAYAVAVTAVDVPAGPVTQGDTIEVDVTVENQGASDANASVTLFYRPVDGPEETADERTVAIAAGETETITLSWDTSDAPLGVYTVRAGATLVEDGNAADSRDAAATITISPPAYAVAVTAVEVASATVIQGVTVDVEVTVENQGTSDANAKVRLLYVPTQGEPGIAADETVALAAGSAETVTLPWDTSGTTPGVYTITAGVALLEDMDAADFRDAASTITISALTYGVSITAFDVPSGPATQGDVVDADVTVENLGSVAAMFTVTLFDQPADGPENAADHETVEIAAAATKTVTLSWDTSDAAPGVHTFRAGVALVEDPKVSDSQDSAATITVSPPPYAVAVTAIEISSATAIQGATVDVEVTVENKGTSNANAKVKLLYVSAMGEPGTAAEKTVAIAAGETVEITLSWDTSGVTLGPYTIRADATLVEDSTAADSRDAVSTITIVTPPPYAVAVTAVEVAIAEAIQGETVEVEVTVANLGTSDANAGVTLRYVPAQGQPGIAAEKTVAIATGESETITLSWDTSGTTPGVYTIRAGATLAEDSTAADSRDPASTITIGALTYGVSITAFDVPSGPATQGDAVDVYVTVENLGSVAAMFTVTLFDQPAEGPEGTAAEETVEIAAAASKMVTLSWDTSNAAPGVHTFRAGVALVEDPKVSDSQDSAATITISIPPAYAVAVTAVDVPAGPVTQGATVDVDVTVENQGASDANASVTLFYRPVDGPEETADERTIAIAAGESETITLSWDTSDTTPGVYTIRADATLDEDTDVTHFLAAETSVTIKTPPYAVAITDVDVPAGPVTRGDTVKVDVTVENRGTSNANAAVTLRYIPNIPANGQPGIAAQKTVAIAAGADETVTLSWDTSDTTPGIYTITAGVTLVEDSNAADSWDSASIITVSPLAYAVAVIAVDVASATVNQGDTVNVEVTVENRGTSDANAAVTLLYIPTNGKPGIAAAEVVAIAPSESETITLAWDTAAANPGIYTIRASATLVKDAKVSDSQDAASTITIGTPTYDVVVTSVDVLTEISTGQVTRGDVVNVDVAIENRSSVAAMFAVTLFYQLAGGQEVTAAEETKEIFEITPGFTKGVSLSWDTSGVAPGVYKVGAKAVLVEVPGVDDVADSLVAELTPITIVTYGVSVTAVDVPTGKAARGETVDVDVTIENRSSVEAMFAVTLFYQPADGQEGTAAEETIYIAAGVTKTVTLSWDTSDATFGVYTIRAAAMLVAVAGVDDVNDSLVAATPITIIARATYGVSVTAVDVPAGPVAEGETVDVDVTIENLGNTYVNAEVTLLYQPDRGLGGIADEETVEIAAGVSVTITLSWDTSGVTPGDHTMRAGVTLVEDANVADYLDSSTTITVVSGRIILGDGRGIGVPDASFGGTLAAAPVETTPSPLTRFLIFGGFAKGYKTSSPVIETSLVPHDKLFTTNAQATFGSGLQNPFELGEIRVTVHLEERPNSLGAHVMVGSQTFFADANGNCRIVVPSGVYDLAIQAPGYVSARIPGVRLGIGEAVTVPELTLPFGDANGDGQIDILDLSVAAGNFGATMHQISLP